MAGVTADTTLEVAERIAAAPVSAHEKDELTRLLALLAGLRLPRRAIVEAMRRKPMIEDLWKESSLGAALEELAQERGEARGIEKGRAEGEARGRAEGEAKGRAEGRTQGMRQMVQIALEGRFGTVDEDVQAALQSADEATLRLLVAHFTTDTIEQVRARLGLSQEI